MRYRSRSASDPVSPLEGFFGTRVKGVDHIRTCFSSTTTSIFFQAKEIAPFTLRRTRATISVEDVTENAQRGEKRSKNGSKLVDLGSFGPDLFGVVLDFFACGGNRREPVRVLPRRAN